MTPLLPRKKSINTFPYPRRLWCPLILVIVTSFMACGGGSSGGGPSPTPPAPTPDFALSVNPTTLSIQDGQSGTASLSAIGSNGFSSAVTVQVSGLPAGVTVSPSALSVTPGTPLQITISADPAAPATTASVTFTGTSGTLSHNAQLSVTNTITVTSNTPPFRMRYVRTDAAIEYNLWENPSWIIYNPPTNRFFVTDAYTNRVIVLDATTESMIGSIIVPGAFNVDDTADHTSLYVGTQIGDVYVVDPVNMVVTKRYVSSEIGTSGFLASAVLVMNNGILALVGNVHPSIVPGQIQDLAFWNPATNSLTTPFEYGVTSSICGNMGYIGQFFHTPDRSKVLLVSAFDDGTFCEIDSTTGAAFYAQPGAFTTGMAFTPDGRSLIAYDARGPVEAHVLDASTLGEASRFPLNACAANSVTFLFVGPDSQTLYANCDASVYAYNLSSGQLLGWLPNIFVPFTSGGYVAGPSWAPMLEAMDGTGLLVGPLEEGVGFLDTTALRTGAVGSQFDNSYLNPATGPAAGGTQASWHTEGVVDSYVNPPTGTLTDVYFGSLMASSPSMSPATITATTPPGCTRTSGCLHPHLGRWCAVPPRGF